MKRVGEGTRHVAAVAFALAAVAVLAAGIAAPVARAVSVAPDFALTDVDGVQLDVAMFRGKVLLLDFMYIGCASCELARPILEEVYDAHPGVMEGISIDILPIDTEVALRNYRNSSGIPWHMARDTDNVAARYGVTEVVRLFLVRQDGLIIYDKTGMNLGEQASLKSALEAKIAEALGGTSTPIDIQELSIFALAALAGVASFFSPCSFPMLPGYITFFLGLDAKGRGQMTKARAAASGALSSLGIILVYGIIGAVLLVVGAAAAPYVTVLQPVVGGLLIFMGALMFTAFQYNWLVNPFRQLRARLFPNWTPNEVRTTQGKLFSYGVGYGAAGFGCVAPPFIAAVLNATALGGIASGLAVLAVYAGVVIALMIAITVILSSVGQAAVKKMNRYTDVIKKVSAAVLIIAGVYLIYYWYSAWVAA